MFDAIRNGHECVVQVLIEAGADVNVLHDLTGVTHLHCLLISHHFSLCLHLSLDLI